MDIPVSGYVKEKLGRAIRVQFLRKIYGKPMIVQLVCQCLCDVAEVCPLVSII